ncbi:hypothetical protein VTO73DRAFT_11840 [Trametes versicolor]
MASLYAKNRLKSTSSCVIMSAVPIIVLSAIYKEDLIDMTVIALIGYEYLLTFDQEVALFWRRKATSATALFVRVRYLGLLTYAFLGAATYAPSLQAVVPPSAAAPLSVPPVTRKPLTGMVI